jgi:hypothetical protein
VADLARGDQFGHRADGFLDRHVHVTAMHVVQVDDVCLQPLQAFVDALAHVRGIAPHTDPARRAVGGIAADPEFRCESDLVASIGEELGDEPLVVAAAVDVGGVDECHPEVHGSVQRGQRFGVVYLAVHRRQGHRPETDCADR